MVNFWKLQDFRPFSVSYAYIDRQDYLADTLFGQEKIPVRFRQELMKEESGYCVVFCRVRKKDCERFERAMGKLPDKMLLCGYKDYEIVCNEVAETIRRGLTDAVA